MSILKKIATRRIRRQKRVRTRIRKESSLPRVSVFRSLKQIYVQLIDDKAHKTLFSVSSLALKQGKKSAGDKTTLAHAVGIEFAKKARAEGIEAAVFDRGRYLYHGRVKAVADGIREGGLKI